jgi:hypothetical protein
MLAYILVIYLGSTPNYIGTFQDCFSAERYVRQVYPTYNSSCLYKDYIVLPKDLQEHFFIEQPDGSFEVLHQVQEHD